MERTLQKLDTVHSSFCVESTAQMLQLSKKQEETNQLLSTVQMALNKTENFNFMKDTASLKLWLNRSESNISRESPLLSQMNFQPRHFLVEVSKKEKNLQNLLEGPPNVALSHSKLGTTRAKKRRFSKTFSESGMGPVSKWQCATQEAVGPRSTARLRFAPGLALPLGPSPALGPALAPGLVPHLDPTHPLVPGEALPLDSALNRSPLLEPAPPLDPALAPDQAPFLDPALVPGRAPFLDPTLAPEPSSGLWSNSAPGLSHTPGPISALEPSSSPGPSSSTDPSSGR